MLLETARRLGIAALTVAWLTACTDPSEPTSGEQDAHEMQADGEEADQGAQEDAPTGTDYPLDDTLRVHHIQCKGTHNSTHIEPEFAVDEWRYTHQPLYDQVALHGVRQVELDVHYNGDGTFDVFHLPLMDEETTCRALSACLGELKAWSDETPGHHLLFVLIEPKDELDFQEPISGHYDELDQAILDVWPADRVLLPDDVRGDYPTLRGALEAEGWPTLGATRQMAMFIMLDNDQHRDGYLEGHPNLEGRVIFARGGVGEPWGAVVEGGSSEENRAAAMAGYLVRRSADSAERSDEANRAKAQGAMDSAAHFISSDFPYALEGEYWFDLPGGAPSRCNPITAPPGCRAADIE